jgi:hypothetical protein
VLQTCAWGQLLVPTVVDTFYLPLGRVPAFRSNVTTAAAVAVEQLGKALTPAWLTDAKKRLAAQGVVFPAVTRVAVTPVWRLSLLVSTIPLPASPAEAAAWLQKPSLGVTQALFSPYSLVRAYRARRDISSSHADNLPARTFSPQDFRLSFLYGADYQAGLVNPAVVNTAGGVVAVPRGGVGRRRRRRALHQVPDDGEGIMAQLLAQCLEEAPDVYHGRGLASPAQQHGRHLAQGPGALSQLPASLLQGLATAWEAHHQGAVNATLAGWGALLSLVLRQKLLGYVDVVPSVKWGESWGLTQIPTVDTTFFFRAGFDIATGAIKTLSLGSPNASTPVRRPVLGVVGHRHRRRMLQAAAPSPSLSPAPGPESGPTGDGAEFTTRVPPNQLLPPSLCAALVALLQAVSADSQAMAAAVQPIIVQLETRFQVTQILDIVLQPFISAVPGQLSFVLPNTAEKWAKFLKDPTLGLLLQSLAGFSMGLSFSVSILSNLLVPPKILPLVQRQARVVVVAGRLACVDVAVPSRNATSGRRRLHAQRQQSPEAVFQAALALVQQHTGISARLQELFMVFSFLDFKQVAVQFLAGAQHRVGVSERSTVHHPFRGAGVAVDAAVVDSAFTIASWTITAASSALVGFSPSLPKAAG